MAGRSRQAFASLEPDVLVMLKLPSPRHQSDRYLPHVELRSRPAVSRTLTAAKAQIAAETMRAIHAAEPDLQIDWDDFKRLCAYGIDI